MDAIGPIVAQVPGVDPVAPPPAVARAHEQAQQRRREAAEREQQRRRRAQDPYGEPDEPDGGPDEDRPDDGHAHIDVTA